MIEFLIILLLAVLVLGLLYFRKQDMDAKAHALARALEQKMAGDNEAKKTEETK